MEEDILKSLEVLQKGGIILYPTDTIWGIGCDATNSKAVEKIYQLKKRVDNKSMLVLVDSDARIDRYVNDVPDIAWQLLEMADKPLTIIYPNAKNLPFNLVADDGSIGIRVAKDEFCQKLIGKFRKPIVSTSAKISSQPSPKNFAAITAEIISGVDYVVKLKQNSANNTKPSSIIRLGTGGLFEIIRN